MTNEEKQLLLKDLCARLPYGVKIHLNLPVTMENGYTLKEINTEGETVGVVLDRGGILSRFKAVRVENEYDDLCVRPYLRPINSMTEEEGKELEHMFSEIDASCWVDTEYGCVNFAGGNDFIDTEIAEVYTDWLLVHHFDYRGLIKKGLALEAPENMYKI